MASTDMFSAMAGWTPTYDSDVTVNVRYPGGTGTNNLRNELSESDMPMRMIGVPEVPGNVEGMGFIRIGKGGMNTYRILDRLYLNPSVMQFGLEYAPLWLSRYMDSYTAQVRANKSPSNCSHIVSVEYAKGWRNWPDLTEGIPHYTIDCIVTIEEFVT